MDDEIALYKYAEVGEIFGGVLEPIELKLVAAKDDKLVDVLECTDALMNLNESRIPKPFSVVE